MQISVQIVANWPTGTELGNIVVAVVVGVHVVVVIVFVECSYS